MVKTSMIVIGNGEGR